MSSRLEEGAGRQLDVSLGRKLGLLSFRDWTSWIIVAVPLAVIAAAYTWVSRPLEDAQLSLGNSTEVANQALAENAELKAQVLRLDEELPRVPQPPHAVACRDPSHGVERYQNRKKVVRESGWRSGGFSQPGWCKQLTSELKGTHPDSVLKVVSSSERKRSRCKPFNCPEYNYSCTIEIQSDPIFVERESPACLQADDRSSR